MADRTTVVQAMRLLRANAVRGGPNLGNAEDTRLVVESWCALLRDLTDDELREAVGRHLASPPPACQYWPQPGVLRSLVPRLAALARIAEVTPEQEAQLAWGRVREAVQLHGCGTYGGGAPALAWDAPTLAGVRACGGWDALGMLEADQVPSAAAAFRGAYAATSRVHRALPALGTGPEIVALLDAAHLRDSDDDRIRRREAAPANRYTPAEQQALDEGRMTPDGVWLDTDRR